MMRRVIAYGICPGLLVGALVRKERRLGATASLCVSAVTEGEIGVMKHSRTVVMIDVWSKGTDPGGVILEPGDI